MMPPGCVSLLSPVAFAGAGACAGSASDVSAVCASSSCFFRWYPPVASLMLSPVASPPLSTVTSAGASASTSGAGDMSIVCASSSCFFR